MRPSAVLVVLLVLGVMLAGCTSEPPETRPLPPPPATLSAEAIRDLTSRGRTLDAGTLGSEARDPDDLIRTLERAGFLVGSERRFSGRVPGPRVVVARVFVFENEPGAATYLDWLTTNADDLIGRSEPRDPLPFGEEPALFVRIPSGCCPKELPMFFATWRRGSSVLSLLLQGVDAERARAESIGAELDRVVLSDETEVA
jgi:hypothetical protein